jgi:hypothetical protein
MKCIALLSLVISLSCANDISIVYTFSEIEILSETGFVNDEKYEKYKDDILVLKKETLYVLGDPSNETDPGFFLKDDYVFGGEAAGMGGYSQWLYDYSEITNDKVVFENYIELNDESDNYSYRVLVTYEKNAEIDPNTLNELLNKTFEAN